LTASHQLPETGFIRAADLIGVKPVTAAQAEANKRAGRSPKRPRVGRLGFVPFSAPTLWRKVKLHEFPAPVKLSAGVSAWRVEDVRAWMASKGA